MTLGSYRCSPENAYKIPDDLTTSSWEVALPSPQPNNVGPLDFTFGTWPPQSVPEPVSTTASGPGTRHHRWISQWNIDNLDRKATCWPASVVTSNTGVTLAVSSFGSPPPVSQGASLSAQSTRGEPQQQSLPTLLALQDAGGLHVSSGECAPTTVFPTGSPVPSFGSPPTEDTLFGGPGGGCQVI